MQTIYIDILLCINLIVNFLLLSAAAFCTHENTPVKRLLLGAAVGAVGSLTILLPPMPFLASAAVKTAVGAATVFSAFGRTSIRKFLKLCGVFLTATFFFGGIVAAVWFLLTPKDLFMKNGVVYLNISPVMLIMTTALSYGAFRLFNRFSGRVRIEESVCILTVRRGSEYMRVPAKIDTGNTLCEPFSGCPVIVVGRETARAIIPVQLKEYETVTTLRYRQEVSGVRFVPFTSVGGRGILPCFKADEVFINDAPCSKCVYVAVCEEERIQGELRALVPCELLDQ